MKVAVVGIGMMGVRMAGRLLDAGHTVTVYNRTRERTRSLGARGARIADTPRNAATGADALITVLADPPAVRAVAGGSDGFLAGLGAGSLWADMSTVSPAASRDFAARAADHGVRMIDAPVSGSLGAAERGMLLVLAGGAARDVAAAKPLLDVLGRATLHLGPTGSGSAAKLAMNAFLCAAMGAATEAVRLGVAAGLDRGTLVEALARTEIMPAWVLGKLERLGEGDVRPAFKLDLALKDLRLVEQVADETGDDLPLLDAVRDRYEAAVTAGLGALDFSAVGLDVAEKR